MPATASVPYFPYMFTPSDFQYNQALNANLLALANMPMDVSTIVGNIGTFWTNAGPAVVNGFNRVFIGEANLGGTGVPPVPKDWCESLLNGTVQNAQLASVNAIGTLAVLGASRTGDFRAAVGLPSGGSQGNTGIGVNNDNGSGLPIAAGVVGIGIHQSTTGVTINQFDVNSNVPVVDISPWVTTPNGSCYSLLITSGAYPNLGTQNVSAALAIGPGTNTVFRKGIVVDALALDPAVGSVVLEMATGQTIRWLASDNVTINAQITGYSGGFTIVRGVPSVGTPSNANAAAAGVSVGGLYVQTGADPAIVYQRTA